MRAIAKVVLGSLALRAAVLVALLSGCGATASAQVTYDPSSGKYTVMVYDDNGHLAPMSFPSPARVSITGEGRSSVLSSGMVRYDWTIRVAAGSPDPLGNVWVPCPAFSRIDTLAFQTTYTHGHVVSGFRHREPGNEYCEFLMRVDEADSVHVEVVSSFLPGFGELRARGFVTGASWPTSDPVADNAQFTSTVDSLSGLRPTGVHVVLPAPVPTVSPTTLTGQDRGIQTLLSELLSACEGGFVSPLGVCESLRVKLASALQSLSRGDRSSALAHLRAFEQELNNQERTHLSGSASAVLATTAGWISSQL